MSSTLHHDFHLQNSECYSHIPSKHTHTVQHSVIWTHLLISWFHHFLIIMKISTLTRKALNKSKLLTFCKQYYVMQYYDAICTFGILSSFTHQAFSLNFPNKPKIYLTAVKKCIFSLVCPTLFEWSGKNTHMPATPTMILQTTCASYAHLFRHTHTCGWQSRHPLKRETAGMWKGVTWWTFTSHPWPRVMAEKPIKKKDSRQLQILANTHMHMNMHTHSLTLLMHICRPIPQPFWWRGGASNTCPIPTAAFFCIAWTSSAKMLFL